MSELSGNRRVVKLSNLSAGQPLADEPVAAEAVEAEAQTPEIEAAEKSSPANNEAGSFASVFAAAAAEEKPAPAPVPEPVVRPAAEQAVRPAVEQPVRPAAERVIRPVAEPVPEPAAEPVGMPVEQRHESLADALAALNRAAEEQKWQEEEELATQVSDEVGIIAAGTKILGDVVTDGHLEINGVVQGSINARGNVRVNGDVYGDIACGNLIIKEGVLKINVQAREDIFLGEKARIEGDIRCRKIGVEGTVIGNVTATELAQISGTATVNGNVTTGNISMGMGAFINGNIKTIR